jgi:electron transfer flavoprotein alpha subunit
VNKVTKVLTVDNEIFANVVAEDISKVVGQVTSSGGFSHVLAPSTANSKNFLPRAAVKLDSAPLNDITAVIDESTFKRPMYAGNVVATVKMSDKQKHKFLTVRTTAFEKAAHGDKEAPVEAAAGVKVEKDKSATFVAAMVQKSDRPDLTSARVVVAGGRGLKSGENFVLLEKLADKLKGAAIGASRAAVDAGFISNEHQVGQTGKVVAPELYIGCGISGAIQHLSGMKDSKVIVVINKDKEAPFFQVSKP